MRTASVEEVDKSFGRVEYPDRGPSNFASPVTKIPLRLLEAANTPFKKPPHKTTINKYFRISSNLDNQNQ